MDGAIHPPRLGELQLEQAYSENWNRTDGSRDLSWALSLVGNWDSQTIEGVPTSRTHNDAHEMTSIGASSLTYDVKGNTTNDGSGYWHQFDFDNHLDSAIHHPHCRHPGRGLRQQNLNLGGWDRRTGTGELGQTGELG